MRRISGDSLGSYSFAELFPVSQLDKGSNSDCQLDHCSWSWPDDCSPHMSLRCHSQSGRPNAQGNHIALEAYCPISTWESSLQYQVLGSRTCRGTPWAGLESIPQRRLFGSSQTDTGGLCWFCRISWTTLFALASLSLYSEILSILRGFGCNLRCLHCLLLLKIDW